MGIYVLFISPGIGSGDAVAAKARYEGIDETDYLDQARIQSVAAELMREFRMTIGSEDPETPGEPRGLDLELEGDELGADVRVDGWGVGITAYRDEPDVKQALAMARTASRLLGGAVYEPSRDRIVVPTDGDPDLIAAAGEAIGARASPAEQAATRRTERGLLLFGAVLLIAYIAARQFLSGVALIAATLGLLAAGFAFFRSRLKSPSLAAPPIAGAVSSSPAMTAAPPRQEGFDNKPLKPG